MEVERISRINGVGQQSGPSQPKITVRRRRFVEELPAPDTGDESTPEQDHAEECAPSNPEDPEDQDPARGTTLDLLA